MKKISRHPYLTERPDGGNMAVVLLLISLASMVV